MKASCNNNFPLLKNVDSKDYRLWEVCVVVEESADNLKKKKDL